MFLNPALNAALDRIAERASDVRRAYTPGAVPQFDDVATARTSSDFTLDPLAVVAPDDTYFVTTDDRGHRTYTRNGSFSLQAGRLVEATGHPVAGIRRAGGPLENLCVDRLDEALLRVRAAGVAADGTFYYQRETVDPRSGARELQRVAVGRVALARFPAATRLETADGTHRTAVPDVEPKMGLANEEGFGPLTPMRRERSRIDIDESLIRLREAYQAFDALQAAEAAKGHLGKTAMDLLK
ncbi:MAG TPA: hypothetical protein VFF63_06600 [Candidatus Babeliales bacterium]|nr:hypothetical protein [Candidatus Babeliales bacterium]